MDNSKDVIVSKESIVNVFFVIGMLIAYFCSLDPWFLWSLHSLYPVLASLFLFVALYISHTMEHPLFDRQDWIYPVVMFVIANSYTLIKRDLNINGYISMLFSAAIFMSMFRIRRQLMEKTVQVITKLMACLLDQV